MNVRPTVRSKPYSTYFKMLFYIIYKIAIITNAQSPSGLNITRIMCEYCVKSCDIQQCNMLPQINKIYVGNSKDLDDDQLKINVMNEHIDVVHQTAESEHRPKEAKDILWFLESDWSF